MSINKRFAEEDLKNEQNIETLHVINAILKLSIADYSIDDTLKETLDLVLSTSAFSFSSCGAIFLVEDNSDVLNLKAQKNLPINIIEKCKEVAIRECLCGKTAYEKKTNYSETFVCTEKKKYPEENSEGNLCVPLIFLDNIQGVINITIDSNSITNEAIDFLTSVANTLSEIIKRKKAEISLRKSEMKFQNLSQKLHDQSLYLNNILNSSNELSIIATDINFFIRYYNLVAEQIFGHKAVEVIGKTVMEIHSKENIEQKLFFNGIDIVKEKGEHCYRIALELNNERHYIDSRVTGMHENGELKGFLMISRDVTQSVIAEQHKEALIKKLGETNEELKNFAYIVSHDLKAPLRAISILSEWILSDYGDKFDEEGKERVKILIGRSKRMQSMIDSILQYSRIGHLEETVEEVDLNLLVMDVIDMLALPSNIMIKIENTLPVIRCEEIRLRQVFQNLIGNAVKFNEKSEGKIKIGCMDKGIFWKFYVNDNGPGIDRRHYKTIFNMFQTLIPKDETEGTGIGLTIAKKIIELYGGKIWVKSQVGIESTFFFTIPKKINAEQKPVTRF